MTYRSGGQHFYLKNTPPRLLRPSHYYAVWFYEVRLLPFVYSSQKNFSQFTVLSHHCLWRFTSCKAGGVTS